MKQMKKVTLLTLTLALCLSLCACDKTNYTENPSNDNSNYMTEPLITSPVLVAPPTEEELSLRDAIHDFYGLQLEAVEYFQNHMNDFPALNSSEIEQLVSRRSFEVVFREDGWWVGTFVFEGGGRIKETIPGIGTGYYNDRHWKVEEDILVLTGKEYGINGQSSSYTEEWQVLEIGDGVFLLVKDQNNIGLMK